MLEKGTNMRKRQFWIAAYYCLCVGTIFASGGTRKAGLWELTTTITWQQSPSMTGAGRVPAKGETRTTQVCLTQEMIDKYGALLPQSRGQCTIANKVMKPGGMTADWVCTGTMRGKGALESTWSDLEHATGRVHFVGTILVGSERKPIEWTNESVSVFKSSDCAGVKPSPLPGVSVDTEKVPLIK